MVSLNYNQSFAGSFEHKMTAAKRPTPENKPSYLLSHDENRQLFNLIGTKCKSLASAVVQVYFADPPGRNQWNKRYCGVICFIKDNIKRSYFLRGKNLQFLSAMQEDTTLYYILLQYSVWIVKPPYGNKSYTAPLITWLHDLTFILSKEM